MDAAGKMQDPTLDANIWGQHYVCAVLVCRRQVLPWGIRL
jgi:hypothetical protein